MISDEALIAERRKIEDREFLIKATDPEVAPVLAPAVNAVRTLLADRRWHSQVSTLAAGLRSSQASVRTIDNILRRARNAGLIERRGEYIRVGQGSKPRDTRSWRLVSWPAAESEKSVDK